MCTLNHETLGQGPNLTLIHGWAADNAVWRPWVESWLAPHFTCHLIELPGFGNSPPIEADTPEQIHTRWREALIDALPPQPTALLGWSLGGLMAQDIALHAPERITHLIGLCTSPRFVQAESWRHGVPPELIQEFLETVVRDTAALLKRFWVMQWQGDPLARQLMRQFVAEMKGRRLPTLSGLKQGLALLRTLDFRNDLPHIHQPTLWLLGEKDPLIPVKWVQTLSQLQPHAQVRVIENAAHLPFRSHPDQTAAIVRSFLECA
ncbi:carboxylesterase BioH (pimeloyl-CoA synthesis) [Sulfurivirga caldicuralii]|uniref:Pimeloyl-[acyl-carrier protein] methyl ester esterase n=1 Tax=Sulfurivirga caldicuralii TaxID=364032 RepID=A0A1N6H770_9GAMM|nr:alpha/beta fold hydrolase [Sulfurivirga caldicuralii]SIO15602.1 carboxylesterase BioH (pimeloyl-CoA synthesis) [Sulfurivirga caldicuralii]